MGLVVAGLTEVGFGISTSLQHHARGIGWHSTWRPPGWRVAYIASHRPFLTRGRPLGKSAGKPMRPAIPSSSSRLGRPPAVSWAAIGVVAMIQAASASPLCVGAAAVLAGKIANAGAGAVLSATTRLTDASTDAFVSAAAAESDRVRDPDDEFLDVAA